MSKRRLIVTGAGGFVAGSVIRAAQAKWEIHAFSRNSPPAPCAGVRWHRFDVLNFDVLRHIVRDIRPDAVIHTAAIGNIDSCESEQKAARRVNTDLTRELAALCGKLGSRLVFVSTDNVFDGRRGRYVESDAPRAVNHYAQTKIAAERAVAEAVADSAVVRLALVVGMPVLGAGNSFLPRTIAMLRAGETIRVAAEEVRTPIDVLTAGEALVELAGNSWRGPIHLAGNDALDRLDLTRRIARRFGCDASLVVAGDVIADPKRAPRPRDVSLDNATARAALKTPMLDFDVALERVATGG